MISLTIIRLAVETGTKAELVDFLKGAAQMCPCAECRALYGHMPGCGLKVIIDRAKERLVEL